jgi:hypothetical protein
MKTLIRHLAVAAVLGASLIGPSAPAAKAEDQEEGYWGHYWKWYDETYQPYYNRRFSDRRGPGYVYPNVATPYYYGGHTTYGPSPTYPYTSRAVPDTGLCLGWW